MPRVPITIIAFLLLTLRVLEMHVWQCQCICTELNDALANRYYNADADNQARKQEGIQSTGTMPGVGNGNAGAPRNAQQQASY